MLEPQHVAHCDAIHQEPSWFSSYAALEGPAQPYLCRPYCLGAEFPGCIPLPKLGWQCKPPAVPGRLDIHAYHIAAKGGIAPLRYA